MPAKSAAQQKAAGAALSAKRGDTPKSKLKGASKSMLSMSEKQLEEFAHTKRKGKPEPVKHGARAARGAGDAQRLADGSAGRTGAADRRRLVVRTEVGRLPLPGVP